MTEQGLPGPGPSDRPHPTGRRTAEGQRIDPQAEAEPARRRTILSALVKHEPGVLAKVAGLFSRRQFNIESLSVGPTAYDQHARMTIVIEETEPGIEQARKQFQKLVPVISVTELAEGATDRELALIKVDGEHPDAISAVAEMYDGHAVDVSETTVTVEITGPEKRIDAAINTFERFGIREVVRTGTAALAPGPTETAPGHGTAAETGTPTSVTGDD